MPKFNIIIIIKNVFPCKLMYFYFFQKYIQCTSLFNITLDLDYCRINVKLLYCVFMCESEGKETHWKWKSYELILHENYIKRWKNMRKGMTIDIYFRST